MPLTVHSVPTMADAARLLAADRGARFLAGGTLLMRAVNEGDVGISTLVRTADPVTTQIRPAGERIRIGAQVTLAQLARAAETRFLAPVVAVIGGPAVRVAATVGGNLFAPSPYGDLGAALLALEGAVEPAGGYGSREIPLEEFYRQRDRDPRMLVAAVSIRRPQASDSFRFLKFSRVHPKGAAVVSVAAWLPGGTGRLQGVRIAFNAMGPTPLRARAAERVLEGRGTDLAAVDAAATAALEGLDPQTDAIASAEYRRLVAPVLLRRLLTAGRSEGRIPA